MLSASDAFRSRCSFSTGISPIHAVAFAQGRKILFTTNLPNVHDIDAALLRPGRCFATLQHRSLSREEGAKLIGRLCGGDAGQASDAFALSFPDGLKASSVAAIYRACTDSMRQSTASNRPRRL